MSDQAILTSDELPDGWSDEWLKWSVNLVSKRATEDDLLELPYISNEDIVSWTGELLKEPQPEEAVDARRFKSGDVLFNKLRPYLAKVHLARFEGVSSGELLCLRPSERVSSRYLFYFLSSYRLIERVNAATFGAKMPRADWDIVGHQPFPMPERLQQERIADFLDERTAQIDGLIAKKESLLALLAEKRQALITRAVTKGLHPDAPKKPSGVDWLGDIPEHWEAGNIRRYARMRTGHTPSRQEPEYWIECTIPWFTLADVWQLRSGVQVYLGDTEEKISEVGLANSAAELLPAGTVILSRTASVGYTGIMPEPMATSQDFWNWVCGPRLHPEFLLWQLRAMGHVFAMLTSGSTHKTIYKGDAASLRLVMPPRPEQEEIAAYVTREVSKLDTVAGEVRRSIRHLGEYRSALITAAVTGQLEVPSG